MEASGGASRGDARTRRTARAQGHIEKLKSGSLRVRVYAGHDKLLHKPLYLIKTISAGPDAEERAEQVRTEFLEQVRVGNHPRSDATIDQLWDEYCEKTKWGRKTRDTNTGYYRKHIQPFLGRYKINNGYLDGDVIDEFYAELERCRDPRR
jgi:integrase